MESTSAAKAAPEILRLQEVSRDYGNIEAVRGVSLAISAGEVHALVGQHGAGKTTLALLISGKLPPKSGSIAFRGRRYASLNLGLSNRLGIKMVYQQVYLNDYFTVAENLFYHDPSVNRFGWSSPRRLNRAAAELCGRHGFDIDPGAKLRALSLSDRTVVDILKQLYARPVLLVLDEALEKLSPSALERIVPLLLERARQGLALLFITHRIDDVYRYADKVSILRDGQLIFSGSTADIDQINLVRLAYTQFSAQASPTAANAEFTRFLRYNEAILAHLPLSLLLTDLEGRVKLANEHFQNAFGRPSSGYLDRPVLEVLEGLSGADSGELAKALQSQADREFYNVRLAMGERDTLNNIKTLSVFDGETPIGTILVLEDITEYDKLQKQILLTEKLASVGLLAAGVAHEINNPLEIIYNYLATLRNRAASQSTRDTVNKLQEEISYISTIVSNLVNLTDPGRLDQGEQELNEVIGKILDLLPQSARSRNINIRFSSGKPAIRAWVNANELKQVVLNLIKNSFEAMPEGGTVAVATDEALRDGVSTALITVQDDGPGIRADNLIDIFLPFYTTKKARGSNSGLGLSVTYAILERYGGRITAENLPRGCRFTITLPQRPVSPPPAPDSGKR
jgi:signal transduction histidine kinase/ABC-type branched-subunit amino acid transport system ATPase component